MMLFHFFLCSQNIDWNYQYHYYFKKIQVDGKGILIRLRNIRSAFISITLIPARISPSVYEPSPPKNLWKLRAYNRYFIQKVDKFLYWLYPFIERVLIGSLLVVYQLL